MNWPKQMPKRLLAAGALQGYFSVLTNFMNLKLPSGLQIIKTSPSDFLGQMGVNLDSRLYEVLEEVRDA